MNKLIYLDITHQVVMSVLTTATDQELACRRISESLDALRKGYTAGNEVDYTSPYARIAYVYRHMSANACLIETIFGESPALVEHFDKVLQQEGKVKIAVFGSGPGTEMLGVSGWVNRRLLPYVCNVDFSLFDTIEGWSKSVEVVVKNVNLRLEEAEQRNQTRRGIEGLCHRFFGPDSNLLEFRTNEVGDHDIFIFPYILSEIQVTPYKLSAFVETINTQLTRDALFLFVDRFSNKEYHVKSNIRAIIDGLELEILQEGRFEGHEISDVQWSVTRTEKFQKLIRMMHDQWPRKKINAFWTICKKLC